MVDTVEIGAATLSDIPAMAAIWPLTMRPNPVMNFIFPDHLYDVSAPQRYIQVVYERVFKKPNTLFFKATCRLTQELVGFIGFRYLDENTEQKSIELLAPPHLPMNADIKLYNNYFGGREEREKRISARKPYVGESLI